jgi:very-short-patch-repair endonuclease
VHRSREAYDRERDHILAGLDVATVRVRNDEVLHDPPAVALLIQQACTARAALCPLSPDSGERAGVRGLPRPAYA